MKFNEKINEKIFKAYDIRGTFPDQLNSESAYLIGRAFVSFLKCKQVVVGRDMRLSSDELFNSLSKGITDQGAKVIDIGLSSTPMMYFAVKHLNADSGINITASHNPKEFNGFKLVREKAIPISGDTGIQEIKKIVLENNFSSQKLKGSIIQKNVIKDYIKEMLSFTSLPKKKFKIVSDSANGMAGHTIKSFLEKLNVDFTLLNEELDGSFPNHEADPLKEENLKDLQKKVLELKADFGIAFDGDADRIVFVDEKGKTVSSDLITALISQILLEENSGSTIIYDLRSSKIVKEKIIENGGTPHMFRVGHSFIKNEMRKENAIFAGELSGHLYFGFDYFFELPHLALILLMKFLEKKNISLSEAINPLRKYFHSGEINFNVSNKEKTLKLIEEKYSKGKAIHLDGLSVEFNDWWFNLRPSNTEQLLRLNLEADSKQLMEEKKKEISRVLEKLK